MTKTEIVLFGPTKKTELSAVDLDSLTLNRLIDLKDLGFILDSGLKLNKQINSTAPAFITFKDKPKLNPS